MHIVRGRTEQEREGVCIQKGGAVYNTHIFIPFFIFVYDYSFCVLDNCCYYGLGLFHCDYGNVCFFFFFKFENFGILYILMMLFNISCYVYPCCFCKLLGLYFMHVCRLYGMYHAFMQPLCIVLINTSNKMSCIFLLSTITLVPL